MPVFLVFVVCAIVAVLWMRRARGGADHGDTPAWLVAVSARRLPSHRREWGQAMVAELAQVHGQVHRWRFAAGVLRVALFPPPRHRARVVLVAAAAVAVAVAATLTAVREVPNLSVFVATLGLLLSGYATVVATRSSRPRWSLPHAIVGGLAVAAGGSAVAAVLRAGVDHPAATADPGHVFSVLFAALLTGYLGFALTPPRHDGRTATVALWWALAATVASGGIWALTALATPASPGGTMPFLSPVAAAATLAAAIGASATVADRAAGVRAGALTIALGAPLHFAAGLTALLRAGHYTLTNPYDIAAFPRSGYPDAASYLLSDAIAGAILAGFVVSPVALTILALLGAEAGTRLRRLRTGGATDR